MVIIPAPISAAGHCPKPSPIQLPVLRRRSIDIFSLISSAFGGYFRLLGTGTNRTLASLVVFTAPPEPTRRNFAGRNRDWSPHPRNGLLSMILLRTPPHSPAQHPDYMEFVAHLALIYLRNTRIPIYFSRTRLLQVCATADPIE
jgi:hypothetical protein